MLQDVYNVELVFGEHLGEAVRFLDGLRQLRRLVMLRIAEAAGIKDICSQTQFPGGFPGDGQLISRHHLYVYPHLPGGRDGCPGFFPGRVEKGQHA
ncbi:MAG: hypothetical protein M0Z48_06240 [Nitrospiraceae bacterium]|nr:hypothetical protein [Nitrospiraceae bacterium]